MSSIRHVASGQATPSEDGATVGTVRPEYKQFVSCPAGYHNDGKSGGRKLSVVIYTFFPWYRNDGENTGPVRHPGGGQETQLRLALCSLRPGDPTRGRYNSGYC